MFNSIKIWLIKRRLRELCENIDREWRIHGDTAHLIDMIANIPVEARIKASKFDEKIYQGTMITILTGPGTGIHHIIDPVTNEALTKIAKDILNTLPWGNPWYPEPVKKEPVHIVEHFDLNN